MRMSVFLIHILLMFIWAASVGEITLRSLVTGFIVSYPILVISEPLWPSSRYSIWFWQVIYLLVVFVWDLVASSLRVAVDALRPEFRMEPGVVKIPLDIESDVAIMLLGNMISLTPGTLTLEVSEDKEHLYIHTMYVDEGPEKVRKDISRLEKLIKRVTE